jgi:hypothetical protein
MDFSSERYDIYEVRSKTCDIFLEAAELYIFVLVKLNVVIMIVFYCC